MIFCRALFLSLIAVLFSKPAQIYGVTINVTTLADSSPSAPSGSLREALNSINADADSSIPYNIVFDSGLSGGTTTLADHLPVINLLTGDVTYLTHAITLNTTSSIPITIDGASTYQIFFQNSGSVTLQNLTLQNGISQGGNGGGGSGGFIGGGGGGALGAGGAIFLNEGTLLLQDVEFSGNSAVGGTGGGNGGASTTSKSGGGGGGAGLGGAIFVRSGSLTISTLSSSTSFSGGVVTAGTGATTTGFGTPGSDGTAAGTDLYINTATVTINVATSLNQTYNGTIAGSGGITKLGGGTLLLEGANSYSGTTLVSAGTLQGNTTSISGAITNNATVVFNQTVDGTYAAIITGSGALTKLGGATLIAMEQSSC